MKRTIHVFLLLLLTAFSIWLFTVEEAAKPGSLRASHQGVTVCENCHVPWKGVSYEQCVICHSFEDPLQLKPETRFHLAHEHCLACHSEHKGRKPELTTMDHTILHHDLLCSQCHHDPHGGLFGQECRECHSITTWAVDGFRHPPSDSEDCHRCHPLPISHQDEYYWERIKKQHDILIDDPEDIQTKQCWRCHLTHDWRHLRK